LIAAAPRGAPRDLSAEERRRAHDYPISRWYLRPAAAGLAALLAPTRLRPAALTFCGLSAAAGAAAILLCRPQATAVSAALVFLYWFFDRADGLLARRQGTVSTLGAWLDANVDELVDLGLHAAVAATVAWRVSAAWPWLLLVAFFGGKYLLMYGLAAEESATDQRDLPNERTGSCHWLRRLYHLPGNADVRVHLLIAALAAGWLTTELAIVACYYNLRWPARYLLVARRLGGAQ
jgi:phosphatidylglycerophosphate synthase